MGRNVEVKLRVRDLAAVEARARPLAPGGPTRLVQRDTYFPCAAGRLKLREVSGDRKYAELIRYDRPDGTDPRPCEYDRADVRDAHALRSLLSRALGVAVVVEKERAVYMHEPGPAAPGVEHVRIHLDRVKGLGCFVELEAVMREGGRGPEGEREDERSAAALVEDLVRRLGLAGAGRLAGSYSDLPAGRFGPL